MPTRRLIAFIIGWFFASVAIGVVTAIVGTEILRLLGLFNTGDAGYRASLNIITFGTFAALVAVPIVFRGRFTPSSSDDE